MISFCLFILIKSTSSYAISEGMFSSAFQVLWFLLKTIASTQWMILSSNYICVVFRHSRENEFLLQLLSLWLICWCHLKWIALFSLYLHPGNLGASQSKVLDWWYWKLKTYLFQWFEYSYLLALFSLCTICESIHLLYYGMAWIHFDWLKYISLSSFLICIMYIVTMIF